MARTIILSTPVVATNDAPGSGGRGPPAPVTSPLVFSKPGTYYFRAPAGVTTVHVESRGGGGGGHNGVSGTAPAGGHGAGGGGFASADIGGPLLTSAGRFLIEITNGGGVAAGGSRSTVSYGDTPYVIAQGGHSTGGVYSGGTASVTPADGVTNAVETTGSVGSAAAAGAGGAGGAAAGAGGGAGGAGGADTGAVGSPGTAPGGGGGGGGGAAGAAGAGGLGGAPRVTFTW